MHTLEDGKNIVDGSQPFKFHITEVISTANPVVYIYLTLQKAWEVCVVQATYNSEFRLFTLDVLDMEKKRITVLAVVQSKCENRVRG